MQYSCEVVACVGIGSIALGMLLGLLLRSEEETIECARWARTYVRQGLQVAIDGMTFVLRVAVCMVVVRSAVASCLAFCAYRLAYLASRPSRGLPAQWKPSYPGTHNTTR
jgi:heme A synthase